MISISIISISIAIDYLEFSHYSFSKIYCCDILTFSFTFFCGLFFFKAIFFKGMRKEPHSFTFTKCWRAMRLPLELHSLDGELTKTKTKKITSVQKENAKFTKIYSRQDSISTHLMYKDPFLIDVFRQV